MTNIIIWNEFLHEVENEDVKKLYPNGIHGCIKEFLSNDDGENVIIDVLKFEGLKSLKSKINSISILG